MFAVSDVFLRFGPSSSLNSEITRGFGNSTSHMKSCENCRRRLRRTTPPRTASDVSLAWATGEHLAQPPRSPRRSLMDRQPAMSVRIVRNRISDAQPIQSSAGLSQTSSLAQLASDGTIVRLPISPTKQNKRPHAHPLNHMKSASEARRSSLVGMDRGYVLSQARGLLHAQLAASCLHYHPRCFHSSRHHPSILM